MIATLIFSLLAVVFYYAMLQPFTNGLFGPWNRP